MNGDNRLGAVLQTLFKPLARVMVAHGVTISVAVESLKQALVVAVERDAKDGEHLTDSRVSLLTGLHRKDVRRLRRHEAPPEKRSFQGGCALAIAYWIAEERFVDSKGRPRTLALGPGSRKIAFQDLIRAAGLDIPASTVLRELERTNVVELSEDRSTVSLLKRAYVPEGSSKAKLEAFEKNLDAHLSASSTNLIGDSDAGPFFDRAAHFNNLSAESVDQLQAEADKLFQSALEALNKKALAAQKRDSNDPANDRRVSMGAYVFAQRKARSTKANTKDDSLKD